MVGTTAASDKRQVNESRVMYSSDPALTGKAEISEFHALSAGNIAHAVPAGGADTDRVAAPEAVPLFALIVIVPGARATATPSESTVTEAESLEVQVTFVVSGMPF